MFPNVSNKVQNLIRIFHRFKLHPLRQENDVPRAAAFGTLVTIKEVVVWFLLPNIYNSGIIIMLVDYRQCRRSPEGFASYTPQGTEFLSRY
jgi:hypothetical protein